MIRSMLERAKQAREAELEGEGAAESGFTLIELMVVLLIIAILLAIAIPTFLGVTSSANNRAAQSNLTNALTEIASQYQANDQSFSLVTTALLQSSAPEFTWETGSTSIKGTGHGSWIGEQVLDVATTGDQQGVILATWSAQTNTCWYAAVLETAATVNAAADTSAWDSSVTPSTQKEGTTNPLLNGGTYYSKRTTGSSCQANDPITAGATAWNWGTDYGAAPAN